MRKLLALITLVSAFAGLGATADARHGKHAVVKTRTTSLGRILVDGRGRTLYLFRKDTGRRSHCSGACAAEWPPLTTRERPEAEGAARQSKLSTSRRAGGARQVLYNGHPLYRYAFDSAPGDTFGQGLSAFGARWFVLGTSGRAMTSP
jgi:predicted lipoprotein with Yx(FWY)xxD motif